MTLTATNAFGTATAGLLLTVGSAPTIYSSLTATAKVGSPFNYTIFATNASTSYGATASPAGLSMGTTAAGQISGHADRDGSNFRDSVGDECLGTGPATLTLTIGAVAGHHQMRRDGGSHRGADRSAYRITANHTPDSRLQCDRSSLRGCPSTPRRAWISGTPTASGTSFVTLSATNTLRDGNGWHTRAREHLRHVALDQCGRRNRHRQQSGPRQQRRGLDRWGRLQPGHYTLTNGYMEFTATEKLIPIACAVHLSHNTSGQSYTDIAL